MKFKLIFFVAIAYGSIAQDSVSVKNYNWAVSVVPQFMLKNGLKIEVDRKLGENIWFVFGIHGYIGDINHLKNANTSSSSGEIKKTDQIQGIGMDVSLRRFLWRTNDGGAYYMQFGLNYCYYNIDFQENKFLISTTPDGSFYKYGASNEHVTIQRYGVTTLLGYQISDPLNLGFKQSFLDINVGLAARNAKSYASLEGVRSYKRTIWDYEYSGVFPTCNLRVGVMF